MADFLNWGATRAIDLVLHTEVAEHTPDWREHLAHVAGMLVPGGALIFTAAGPGRAPHAAIDGAQGVRRGEWYENIDPAELNGVIAGWFSGWTVAQVAGDVRAVAVR